MQINKQVWKFAFPRHSAELSFSAPCGHGRAQPPVHVGLDPASGEIAVWVEVWPCTSKSTSRTFQFFGTGHDIPPSAVSCGTVIAGPFVWHVYETTDYTGNKIS